MMIQHKGEQLVLDLPVRVSLDRESFFVAAPNAAALAAVEAHTDGVLALEGPDGAGKSHLAVLWAEANSARTIDATGLRKDHIPALLRTPLVVEDVAGTPDHAEVAMFHLLNFAKAEGGRVLLTGAGPIRSWARLPDLSSRLQALPRASLQPPDDALLAAVLIKQLRDRHVSFSEAAIAFALPRMERSFAAARHLANALDRHALATKRSVSRAVVQEVLERQTDQ